MYRQGGWEGFVWSTEEEISKKTKAEISKYCTISTCWSSRTSMANCLLSLNDICPQMYNTHVHRNGTHTFGSGIVVNSCVSSKTHYVSLFLDGSLFHA